LIDYDLGKDQPTGLDIILKNNLQSSAILMTNRFDDAVLQDRVRAAGVRLLPKPLIPHVPIRFKKLGK
jgi:hypothetical protein